jgi:DNA-binding SARP family transcriptional activator
VAVEIPDDHGMIRLSPSMTVDISSPFTPSTSLTLRLFDGFDLRADGASVIVPGPAQRLLAFLALQRRPVNRRAAAAALWTDCDDQQALGRLRSTLWRLPSCKGERLVDAQGGRLRLASQLEVDIHYMEDEGQFNGLDVSRLSGELLTGWDDEWVVAERERLRQLVLHRLENVSELAQQQGRYGMALQAALAAVSAEPLRESAHRRVMLVHRAEQNPSEALRQYDLVRVLLRNELGLAPSASTRAVVADLLGRPLDSGISQRIS